MGMRKTFLPVAIGVILITLFLTACSTTGTGRAVDVKLLENAAPKNSAMRVFRFDGENTVSRIVFDNEWEKRVIDAVNSLQLTTAEETVLSEWTEPCYGIEITDKDGMSIWLTYSNGLWIEKGGALYRGELDMSTFFEEAASLKKTLEDVFESGIYMPNAAILAKHSIRYCRKETGEEVTEKDGISLHFVSFDGKRVTVEYENTSDKEYTYGTYFCLQKKIDGTWYMIPVALSNYVFPDIAYILPSGESRQEVCDLTLYGDLEDGYYRIVKENLYAEFGIGTDH